MMQGGCNPLFFLVPKPRLGNALAGEAPASRDGRRTEAGAWERGKKIRAESVSYGNQSNPIQSIAHSSVIRDCYESK